MDYETLRKRFETKWKRDPKTGCWIWTASTAGRGYGQIKIPGTRKQMYAHRLSYELYKGRIAPGKQLLHSCDNPRCVNPDHLSVGSSKDNHTDMKNKGRHLFGERNPTVRLSEAQVIEIRKLLAAGIVQKRIAVLYGVSQITISRINTRSRWAHLKG